MLEDLAHQIRALAGTDDFDQVVPSWDIHAREIHHDHQGCVRRPVVIRGQLWGWLHVLSPVCDDIADIAMGADRAAAAIVISLLTDRSMQARMEQRSTALISRLCQGDLTGPEFVTEVAKLGIRLKSDRLVVIVVNADPGVESSAPQIGGGAPTVTADMGDYLVAIVAMGAKAKSDVGTLVKASHTGAGVSGFATPQTLSHAITQAKSAAVVAHSHPDHPVLHFDELGVERLLVALAPSPELASFIEDKLGALLAFDARTATPLLPTLREYLKVDGHKTEAAQVLYIQRRTLYNRLERISSIIGHSLDDPATRQTLLIAIQALDLLRRTSASPSSAMGTSSRLPDPAH